MLRWGKCVLIISSYRADVKLMPRLDANPLFLDAKPSFNVPQ
jgi:hypothetical protein